MRRDCFRGLILGLILAGAGLSAHAQDIFPSRRNLDLAWHTSVTKTEKGFDYLYRLTSHPTSQQIVRLIKIDNLGGRGQIQTPKLWDQSWGRYRVNGAEVGWFPGTDRPDVDDATQYPNINGIEPGQTSPEFGVRGAPDPPGIVQWRVSGFAKVPVLDEERGVIISEGIEYPSAEIGTELLNNPGAFPNANLAKNVVAGYTLGARTPPEENQDLCEEFIPSLIRDIDSAVALGWILPDGAEDAPRTGGKSAEEKSSVKQSSTANYIRGKLLAAKGQCGAKNYEAASRSIADALVKNCAEWKNTISDNAYQLIRFNGEYIIEKFGFAELAPACQAPTGTLRVQVRARNKQGRIVNAQGVDVTVNSADGTITRTGTTGWGATSGRVVFDDLSPGEYAVKAGGKSGKVVIAKNETSEAKVGP